MHKLSGKIQSNKTNFYHLTFINSDIYRLVIQDELKNVFSHQLMTYTNILLNKLYMTNLKIVFKDNEILKKIVN